MKVGVEMISAGHGLGAAAGAMVVYYEGLLSRLAQHASDFDVVAFTRPKDSRVGIPAGADLDQVTCAGLPSYRLGRVVYEHLVLPRLVNRTGVDVLLSTCNVKPLLWRGASVVVLQSLQYLFYPKLYEPLRLRYLRTAVPRSLRSADAVIAVSEWERAVAIEHFQLDARRVFTVYHGVSTAVRRAADTYHCGPSDVRIKEPFVAMVSTFYAYKNHRRLIEAFAQLIGEHRVPHRLVLVGGDGDVTRGELEHVAETAGVRDRVHFTGPVNHSDVPAILARADAVAYVSECETFGLPVIEALALGRPLVTSRACATAELAGDAALLIDPTDVDDIATGLAAAILDHEVRRTLQTAGPRRAQAFTWDSCAEKTAAVLRFAVDEGCNGSRDGA